MSDNLFTDDNPETTLHGLGFKTPEITNKSIDKIESYFKERYRQQKIPGYPINLRPKTYLETKSDAKRYYQTQMMTRVLALLNRARSIYKKIVSGKKREEYKLSISILQQWVDNHKLTAN